MRMRLPQPLVAVPAPLVMPPLPMMAAPEVSPLRSVLPGQGWGVLRLLREADPHLSYLHHPQEYHHLLRGWEGGLFPLLLYHQIWHLGR